MSESVKFRVAGVRTTPYVDSAHVEDGEDPIEVIAAQVWDTLKLGVGVTIGGVTKHMAAWLDPDHWGDES